MPDPLLVSDQVASKMLGVCRSTFLKLLRSGRLDVCCHKLGRRRLYSTDELRQWVAKGCRRRLRGGGVAFESVGLKRKPVLGAETP